MLPTEKSFIVDTIWSTIAPMNGKGKSRISRRTLLSTGATTLSMGLAGCSFQNPLDDRPEDTGETHRYQRQDVIEFQSVSQRYSDGSQRVFNYDDLPERGSNWNIDNRGHPDSRNIELDIQDGSVTATLKQFRTQTELALELWMSRNGNWERVGETNTPFTETWTGEWTHEFTDLPSLTTHTANSFSLIAVEDPPEWNNYPGRYLKSARYIAVPYDDPNGRTTRVFDGREINYESYQGELEPPTIDSPVYIEDLENDEKAIFVIIDTDTANYDNEDGQIVVPDDHGGYGVATTISQDLFDEQNYTPQSWTNMVYQISDIETTDHFNTLGNEIKTANEKLGNWGTTTEKLESIAQITEQLPYERRGRDIRHPTGALFQNEDGRNCTEKSYIFSALLQSDPLNYSGDDATYVGCKFNGQGHFIMGVNTDNFEETQDNWEIQNYIDEAIEDGAPPDEEYVLIEVTGGRVGNLDPTMYSNYRVWQNLDGDY